VGGSTGLLLGGGEPECCGGGAVDRAGVVCVGGGVCVIGDEWTVLVTVSETATTWVAVGAAFAGWCTGFGFPGAAGWVGTLPGARCCTGGGEGAAEEE